MELFQTFAAASGLVPPAILMWQERRQERALKERYEGKLEHYRFSPLRIEKPMLYTQDGLPFLLESVVVERDINEPGMRNFYLYLTNPYNIDNLPPEEVGEEFLWAKIQEDGSSIVDLGFVGGAIQTAFGRGDILRFKENDFGVELSISNGDEDNVIDIFSQLNEKYVDPALNLGRDTKVSALLGVAGIGLAGLAEVLGVDTLKSFWMTFGAGTLAYTLQHALSNYRTWRQVQDALKG